MVCEDYDGAGSLLRADLRVSCESASYRVALAFVVIGFMLFSVGFPVLCFWLLYGAFGKKAGNKMTHRERVERFGYLFRHLKQQTYWYALFSAFCISFGSFALVSLSQVPYHLVRHFVCHGDSSFSGCKRRLTAAVLTLPVLPGT